VMPVECVLVELSEPQATKEARRVSQVDE
jgi:hypothetical protein